MSTTAICIIIVATALLAVALTGLIFLLLAKRYFDHEQKRRLLDIKMEQQAEVQRTVSPIRLQAYERMALFLERISPNSLVLRCYKPGMDLKLLQGVMTKNIRDEWEHNLSQQVYLSSEAWNHVREAKEQMINLVNASAAVIADKQDAQSLAGAIFATTAKTDNPTDAALEFLKEEIRQTF